MVRVLEKCGDAPAEPVRTAAAPTPPATPATEVPTPGADVAGYLNCDAVRSAGVAPITEADPG